MEKARYWHPVADGSHAISVPIVAGYAKGAGPLPQPRLP